MRSLTDKNPTPGAVIPFGAEVIRASSLPTWADCERRWVAVHRRRMVSAAGFDLGHRPPSIGAHVGTGAHAGVAHGWLGVQKAGAWSPLDECDDVAVEVLRGREEQDGAMYDRTSPDRNAAEAAARKIIRAYRGDIPRERRPELIEAALAARIDSDWFLSGHADLFTEPDRACEDLKTGVRPPTPMAQIGAYGLMLVAGRKPVARTRMVWIRRVGAKTEQPPPMTVAYEPKIAMRVARHSIDEIVRKVGGFMRSADASPFRFKANPASVLCGAKYCPAWRTAWCPESAGKQGKDDDA